MEVLFAPFASKKGTPIFSFFLIFFFYYDELWIPLRECKNARFILVNSDITLNFNYQNLYFAINSTIKFRILRAFLIEEQKEAKNTARIKAAEDAKNAPAPQPVAAKAPAKPKVAAKGGKPDTTGQRGGQRGQGQKGARENEKASQKQGQKKTDKPAVKPAPAGGKPAAAKAPATKAPAAKAPAAKAPAAKKN